MIEGLRAWILTLVTVVFFMTAVEMLLPNNNLKKYAKFVFGLIIITVFVNPIIKLYDSNYQTANYGDKVEEILKDKKHANEYEKYKEKSMNDTLETFKLNLQQNCEKKLKEKYPQGNYKVSVEAAFNDKEKTVLIKALKVGVKDGTVERVKKVKIGSDSKSVTKLDNSLEEKGRAIKSCLSNELKVSEDIIDVYKL